MPGTSLTIAEMENAGSCLDWAMRQVLFREAPQTAETYRAFEALAATSEPGANDLFFLPWLYGERSPFPNERLRGGWLGASLTTRSADLARSVFEGYPTTSPGRCRPWRSAAFAPPLWPRSAEAR